MLKKYLCVLLALCLLFSLVSCASSGNSKIETEHPFIECPLPGIEWGMTKAEVLEKITFPEDYPYPGDIESLKEDFSNEDTGTWVKPSFIGWEDPSVAGMELSYYAFDSTNLHAISLCFSEPINGEQYLVEVIISLRAEDEEAYNAALTATYGHPVLPAEGAPTPLWVSAAHGTEVDAATVAAYEEAGLHLTKYFDPSLQTWHLMPVVYPFLGSDEVVDGMLNFPTIFDAYQYVMVKLYEEGVLPVEQVVKEDVYAAPIPGFYWGIAWEDAAGLLQDAGIDAVAAELQTNDENGKAMRLSKADAEKLGFTSVIGLSLAGEETSQADCVDLRFLNNKDGTPRLVSAVLLMENPGEDALRQAMEVATIGVLQEGRGVFETVWITMAAEDALAIDTNQLNSEQLAAYEHMMENDEGSLCFPYLYYTQSATENCVKLYMMADFYVYHCYGNF